MSSFKESLLKEIDRLDEEAICRTFEFVQSLNRKKVLERLKDHPAIKVPSETSGGFREVKPVKTKGVPASRLLVGDRR